MAWVVITEVQRLTNPSTLLYPFRVAYEFNWAPLPDVFSGGTRPGLPNLPLWTIRYELCSCAVFIGSAVAGLVTRRALALAAAIVTTSAVVMLNRRRPPTSGPPETQRCPPGARRASEGADVVDCYSGLPERTKESDGLDSCSRASKRSCRAARSMK
jgi:hypothetical protein